MNKKVMSVISAAAVLSAAAVPVYAAEGENLVVLGDSITSGYGLDGYIDGDNSSAKDSFANRLSENFSGYDNFAVDGRTSDQLLEALAGEDYMSAVENADSVVISIGGNDFFMPVVMAVQMSIMSDPDMLQEIMSGSLTEEDILEKLMGIDIEGAALSAVDNVDLEKVGDNINGILDTIYTANPDCDVYILTVYNPFKGNDEWAVSADKSDEKTTQLNEKIIAAADAHEGTTVIDVNSAFKGHELEYTNIEKMDIHPNKDGHALIYDMITEAMAEKAASAPASEETPVAEETPAAETAAPAEPAAEEVPEDKPVYVPAADSSTGGASTGNTDPMVYMGAAALSLAFIAVSLKTKKI